MGPVIQRAPSPILTIFWPLLFLKVVFVGDESHGKTTTLARMIFMLLLPSSNGKYHTSYYVIYS